MTTRVQVITDLPPRCDLHINIERRDLEGRFEPAVDGTLDKIVILGPTEHQRFVEVFLPDNAQITVFEHWIPA